MPINTAAPFALDTDIDHIRLLYNADMNNPSMSATTFETYDVNPGLAYFYSLTDRTTNFNLAISNFKTPASAMTFVSGFKA